MASKLFFLADRSAHRTLPAREKDQRGQRDPSNSFFWRLLLSASIHRKAKKKRSSGNYVHLAKSHCDLMDLSESFACRIVNGHGRLQAFVLSQRSVDDPRMERRRWKFQISQVKEESNCGTCRAFCGPDTSSMLYIIRDKWRGRIDSVWRHGENLLRCTQYNEWVLFGIDSGFCMLLAKSLQFSIDFVISDISIL